MSEKEFELYNKFEKDYWWFKARRNILSVFLDLIEYKETKTILEIGCGTGGNLKYLFTEFGKRIGLEYNDEAISFAKNKLPFDTEIVKGDANNLNLPDESVDCIALLDVLDHKNIKNVGNVLLQVEKILNKDGYLLISDGAFDFLQGRHSKNVDSARRFTKKELITKLKKTNFRIVKASYWGFSLFFILLLKRIVIEKFLQNKENQNQFDLRRTPLDPFLYFILNLEKYIIAKRNILIGSSIAILAKKSSV